MLSSDPRRCQEEGSLKTMADLAAAVAPAQESGARRRRPNREQKRFEARARHAGADGRLWRTPRMDLEPLTRHR